MELRACLDAPNGFDQLQHEPHHLAFFAAGKRTDRRRDLRRFGPQEGHRAAKRFEPRIRCELRHRARRLVDHLLAERLGAFICELDTVADTARAIPRPVVRHLLRKLLLALHIRVGVKQLPMQRLVHARRQREHELLGFGRAAVQQLDEAGLQLVEKIFDLRRARRIDVRDQHGDDRRTEVVARRQQFVTHEREQRTRRHPERCERRRNRNDAEQIDRETHVVEHLPAALLDNLGNIAKRVDHRHDVADDRHRAGKRLHILERDVIAADAAQPCVEAVADRRDVLRRNITEPGDGLFLLGARWKLLCHVVLRSIRFFQDG
nr:hypothetical protein [Burkholderia diffusa]